MMKFMKCKHCGNIIEYVEDKGEPVVCRGESMQELIPGTVDAAVEKHVPVLAVDGNQVTVTVGATRHPMTEKHHIAWIALETKEGTQRKMLDPVGEPTAVFALTDSDKLVAAYAYCNLHGLWKTKS